VFLDEWIHRRRRLYDNRWRFFNNRLRLRNQILYYFLNIIKWKTRIFWLILGRRFINGSLFFLLNSSRFREIKTNILEDDFLYSTIFIHKILISIEIGVSFQNLIHFLKLFSRGNKFIFYFRFLIQTNFFIFWRKITCYFWWLLMLSWIYSLIWCFLRITLRLVYRFSCNIRMRC
jgi:hypothetical protein